jgi:hypothetical protein
LGAEGGKALAQALPHLPQLRTLSRKYALASAQPARAVIVMVTVAARALVCLPVGRPVAPSS